MSKLLSPVDGVKSKIPDILRANGITDQVSEVKLNDAGLQGEGMISDTMLVTLKFANEQMKPLNLFAKVHTKNDSHTEMVAEIRAFEREAMFYMEYLPAAKEFCTSRGHPDIIDFFPKCYYADEDMTILENLFDRGYALVDKQKLQGYDDAKAALTSLAKHHAIAYALIQDQGQDAFCKRFSTLTTDAYFTQVARNMIEPLFENGVQLLIKVLEKNPVEGSEDAISSLNLLKGKTYSMLQDALQNNEPNEFMCLNHGDYWNNNMMFLKDPDTREVKGHIAIDMQATRYNSPGLDLGYYIFTSIQPDVRRSRLKDLLQVYLEILNKTSDDLGHPINMSYDELFLIFRRKFSMGFCFGLAVSTGPGYAALKEYNTEELGDMSNWAVYFDSLMQRWIENNPEKGKAMAENIVKVMRDEYHKLIL